MQKIKILETEVSVLKEKKLYQEIQISKIRSDMGLKEKHFETTL